MAIVKKGTLTVTTGGSAQTLNLGFVPSYFRMENKTKITATTNGVVIGEWYNDMPNATAYIWTTSGGDGTIKLTYLGSNGVTPANPSPALGSEFVPTNMTSTTNIALNTATGISKAANAVITTSGNNPITAADVGVTTVTFHNIQGMTQINGLSGVVTSYISGTQFTVNIDTTSFSTYTNPQTASPIANVITGEPPSTTSGFQIYNTPLLNNSFIGLTLGSSLMVTTSDVWEYVAYLDASFTSD